MGCDARRLTHKELRRGMRACGLGRHGCGRGAEVVQQRVRSVEGQYFSCSAHFVRSCTSTERCERRVAYSFPCCVWGVVAAGIVEVKVGHKNRPATWLDVVCGVLQYEARMQLWGERRVEGHLSRLWGIVRRIHAIPSCLGHYFLGYSAVTYSWK